MRNTPLVTGEIYHVFNRGVDKRTIFLSKTDLDRFYESMEKFNTTGKVGHLNRRRLPETTEEDQRLVKFVAYNINENHFHFILEQLVDRGIERFMHRLSMGLAKFFNLKYKRSGALLQGRFKAVHVDSNEYLLHLSAYVNLNDLAHSRGNTPKLSKSSWEEYLGKADEEFCEKSIILDQFKKENQYQQFAESTLEDIINRKTLILELEDEEIELINTI